MGYPEQNEETKDYWREIKVACDARAKEITVGVFEDTAVSDIITAFREQCARENIDMARWAEKMTGDPEALMVLIRKSNGNEILHQDTLFGELDDLNDGERFDLKAEAIVG